MSTPLVGIVSTAYGHAAYLPECLASVQAQADRRFIHVVVDDASPDGTWDILKHADGILRIRLTANAGLAGAFHAGVAMLPPECEWILKCDADDMIHPAYVGEILAAAAADPQRNVIFSPCQHFGERSDVFRYPVFDARRMADVFMIPGPAAYRRSLWDAVGGYDVTMRSAEDWDFYIRAQRAVGLTPHQLPHPRWLYRMHAGVRASDHGLARLRYLRAYWQGHTAETARAGSRSWGAWCAERSVAA